MKKFSSFIWNMLGSSCYSISSFFFLIVVTRICGVEEGGFFSLSYATAQLLLTIGRYGMRTYQATDLRFEYSFSEYILSRTATVLIMLLAGILYSAISFDGAYLLMSVLIVAMKAIDAIEDIYHGRMQQLYHVAEMGKSQFFRNLYTSVCFTLCLLASRNLLFTLWITVLSSLLFCIILNQVIMNHIPAEIDGNHRLSYRAAGKLLYSCTGLFLGTFLSLYLFNIPKYAMAGLLEMEYQTYYSILFMPTFVMTLLCEFIFKPTITSMAGYWFSNQKARFSKTVLTCFLLIAAFTLIVIAGGHFLGRYLLELIYGVNLSPYKLDFVILLLGGGINAAVYLTYNILIAIRYDKSIKLVYGVTALLCVIVVKPMILQWGMLGAALNHLLSSILLLLLFLTIFLKICRKHR